ncbi:MAG TPA: response regulator, partial [Candidatus Peribacteraceae bacterium]|nr:response regulator [Candidatus Peribacteraceae bacterium]
ILIAEDETSLADVMEEVLRKNKVRVTVANNGQEALALMEKEVPDVLLLDLLMPVLDGHGVMKAMRRKQLECPVIVVSNVSDQKTKDACKKFGVKAYFVKSDMDDDDLWTAIEKYLH